MSSPETRLRIEIALPSWTPLPWEMPSTVTLVRLPPARYM